MDAYDGVAESYGDAFFGELSRKPFDRDVLERFAAALEGPVADIGCGPGQVARFLKGCGLEPLGIDLSPRMVALAQRLNPELRFAVGDMRGLAFPSGTFTGVVSFYAVIHLNRAEVVKAFRELHRVLKPGGRLLASFHIGEGETHLTNWFDKPVSLSFTFFQPAEVVAYLVEAGFSVVKASVRPPYPFEVQTERGYILAERPARPHRSEVR